MRLVYIEIDATGCAIAKIVLRFARLWWNGVNNRRRLFLWFTRKIAWPQGYYCIPYTYRTGCALRFVLLQLYYQFAIEFIWLTENRPARKTPNDFLSNPGVETADLFLTQQNKTKHGQQAQFSILISEIKLKWLLPFSKKNRSHPSSQHHWQTKAKPPSGLTYLIPLTSCERNK